MTVTNSEIGAYVDSLADIGTPASGDELLIYDVSATATKKVLASEFLSGASGTDLHPGTSFPVSPSAGDLCYRTDLGVLCAYDGSNWLGTTQALKLPDVASVSASGASTVWVGVPANVGSYTIKVVDFIASTLVATNTGSAYWAFSVDWLNSSSVWTTLGSFNTSADTGGTPTQHVVSVNTTIGSTARAFRVNSTKTGSPTNGTCQGYITYRVIYA